MHGIIFAELKKYVVFKFGEGAWPNLIKQAGLPSKIYLTNQSYSDQEAIAIIQAAANHAGKNIQNILEDFGRFIVPDLLSVYKAYINPDWQTLDTLLHTENSIHKVVRLHNREATPPKIKCERSGENEVTVQYASPRKMCKLGEGIIEGIADHFKEKVLIRQTSCMLSDDPVCNIVVKVLR